MLFVLVIAAVYAAAFLFLAERVIAFARKRPRKLGRIEFVAYALAGVGVLCFLDGYFIEPYWPQVTHVTLKTAKFPPGSAPLRIVHISDLHTDPKPHAEAKVLKLIREQRPDLICFTGDAANENGVAQFRAFMTELGKIAPVYAVRGNWDEPWESHMLYDYLPVNLLGPKATEVEIKGHQLAIGGLHADEVASIAERYSGDASAYRVFLYHYPDAVDEVATANIDLYLAGHTHGGQIRLPFYGALITFSRYDKKYEAGSYQLGKTAMYVNRGIGMEGGKPPRVRFLDRPEVTVIEVVPQ